MVAPALNVRSVSKRFEIYERPATRFVADFIGVSNFLLGRLRAAGAEGIVELANGQRVRAIAPPDLPVERVVTVAVRPERMRLMLRGDRSAGAPERRDWNEVSRRLQIVATSALPSKRVRPED